MQQPTTILDSQKLSYLQLSTILICFLMNMLDGMDVMVISYVAPHISSAWSISPQSLGIVFSAGLLGMSIGAMFLAPFADKIGRKTMILICGLLMGISVFSTILANSVEALIFFRVISGLGIGGMLASTATLTAEYAPKQKKDFWVSFVISGYPIGAVLSGMVAAKIIPLYGWQTMFQIAGITTLVTLPVTLFFLSESLDFLLKTQPKNALSRANSILSKMTLPTLTSLPNINNESKIKISVTSLLKPETKTATIRLWIAIFMAFASLYFLTTWIPKLALATGLSVELAIYAGTIFNLGAFLGIVSQGYLSSKFGLKKTICGFLVVTAFLMLIFGFFSGSVMTLILFGLIGFGIQGGFVGLYSVAARIYPTEIRTTGVGWAVGAGRIGAIVGPILGGVLIGLGLSMSINFIVFAVPTLIGGIITLYISSDELA
jgi:AAHS family 4-hydroxybenzoate transporter-like MFS transporter